MIFCVLEDVCIQMGEAGIFLILLAKQVFSRNGDSFFGISIKSNMHDKVINMLMDTFNTTRRYNRHYTRSGVHN